MESQEKRSTSPTTAIFDFNKNILFGETIRETNIEDCKEEHEFESMERSRSERNIETKQTSCHISGVDGLPSTLKKRKYKMAQHVRKEKGTRRIGSTGAEKVFLANVEEQLQSSICSKGCLKKLDARAILMKWFRA